jgi:IS30 family transposase
MTVLPRGKRSVITRLHNRGWSIKEIAKHIGFPADAVERFLRTREGYPGKIPCPRAEQLQRQKTGAGKYIDPPKPAREKPSVSLPRLSFLEKADS